MSRAKELIELILKERWRQEELWGEQTHPCLNESIKTDDLEEFGKLMTKHYNLPDENTAKFMCESSFKEGLGTYAHIALEEFIEVVSEPNIERRKIELIQLTAVCIGWLESIERQIEK